MLEGEPLPVFAVTFFPYSFSVLPLCFGWNHEDMLAIPVGILGEPEPRI